jgi:membrane-associated phospholipid phosphatase
MEDRADNRTVFVGIEPVDLAFFGYLTVVGILLVVRGARVHDPWLHGAVHALFCFLGVVILVVNTRRPGPWVLFCRVWYVPFLYVFVFEDLGYIIHLLSSDFHDGWVLALEARVFGGYPTVWTQEFVRPWLTELMASCYMTYYFFIPALGMPLYFRGEHKRVNDLIFTTSVTFFFCYLHYLAFPVAGPIFVPDELPFNLATLDGGPVTAFEQWLFARGAIQGAAFPSSHVAIAVAVVVLAVRYRRGRVLFPVVAVGLALSTIYNGYHYGVDVFYGAVVGSFFALLCPGLNRLWTDYRSIR